MNVMFFRYAGDPDMLDKQLGTAVYTQSNLKPFEQIDDLNVRLIMDYNTALRTCTYLIASEAGQSDRCYFITGRMWLTGGRIALICSIDVLETYSAAIKAMDCIIKRTSSDPDQNENGWNSLLDDQWAVTEVNTDEFEVGMDIGGGAIQHFEYDTRPYLAVIGYDAPNGSMRGTVDNFQVFK